MKKMRYPFLLIAILILSSLLSSCVGAGAATTVQIWPGLTLDAVNQVGYVAYQNQVYAVDLTTGTQKWLFQGEKNVGFSAPPVLTADGQLVFGAYNGTLYSIDPQNGQEKWRFPQKPIKEQEGPEKQGATNRYYAGALALDSNIFAPNIDHTLYAVNEAGSQVWKFTTNNALWSTPVSDGKTIYLAGMDHKIYALDPKTGKEVWQTDDLGGSISGTPALSEDGKLYVGTYNSEILALDAANKNVIWRKPVTGWVYGGPLLDQGVLYFGDLSGTFYAKDAATGEDQWRVQPDTSTKSEISGTPVVVGDTVYFGSEAGILYAYDIANGQKRWDSMQKPFGNNDGKTTLGKLYAPTQASGDTIYISPMGIDSLLIAIDTEGNQKWSFIPSK